MKTLYSLAILLFFSAMVSAQATENIKAFPPAGEGMVRHVLQLPKQDDESAYRVELIVGRMVQVDAGNKYFFSGKIEAETVKGWGFPCYNVSALGQMAGTLMAIDPDAPKVNRFITLGGEPYLIRYNSRLPVVVYAPEGVEVRYRLWSAEPESRMIGKG
jgi:ecotin